MGSEVKPQTIALINRFVSRARTKWPKFAENKFHALSLIMEELGEAAKEANDGDFDAMRKEILDTIAVCVRILEGD